MTPALAPPAPPAAPPGGPGTSVPGGPDATPEDDWAWRCSACDIDWPVDPALFDKPFDYHFERPRDDVLPCPQCRGDADIGSNLNPIPAEEALRLKRHADFGRYYERTRGRPLAD